MGLVRFDLYVGEVRCHVVQRVRIRYGYEKNGFGTGTRRTDQKLGLAPRLRRAALPVAQTPSVPSSAKKIICPCSTPGPEQAGELVLAYRASLRSRHITA